MSSVKVLRTFPVIKTGLLSRGICLSCVNFIVFDVQIVIHADRECILTSSQEGVGRWNEKQL